MGNEYLRLQDASMNVMKAQNMLAVIEDKRKDDIKDVQSENDMFRELWKAFKNFFANLGMPSLQKRFIKKTAPTISSSYNDTMRELRDDMRVAYTEVDSLGNLLVKNFNYGESGRQSLLSKVRKLNSKTIDYSFYSKGAKDRSLYGIDSFIDRSKVDPTKVSAGTLPAEIVTDQGVATLARTGNIDRGSLVRKVTGISESMPGWSPIEQTGGYEGLYFGMRGEARPEGGNWHLEYTANGDTLFEKGASDEGKMPRRMTMFDGSPETFWEAEYVVDNIIGYQNKYDGKQITVSEFGELRDNEINSPNTEIRGDTVVADEYGSLVETYVPVTSKGVVDFLNISFIVHLSRSVEINWLNLNPNNFGTENYIDVMSVNTYKEPGSGSEKLVDRDDHEYDLILTSEANEELTPSQVLDTLAPDKFKYAGQGIWTFASRPVRMIEFNLRQPQSYIKPYEVLKYRTEQEVTSTTTKAKGGFAGLFGQTKTTVDTRTDTREVELPYLEGMVNGFDVMGLDTSGSDYTEGEFFEGADIANVVGNILLPFTGFGIAKTQSETTKSDERIVKQWTVTKYDKARFAIGIRDIGVYSYKFSETSELVSQPYISPKPISKLSLTVDESIPKTFYMTAGREGTENNWIKYFVSVDDGVSWARISPINHTTTLSDDGLNMIPEVININSDIGEDDRENPLAYIDLTAPSYRARVKAVFSRPTDASDSESFTPVLSKYALKIYPHGGL